MMLAFPGGASSAESRTISLGGPTSPDACSPCHPRIGTSRNPAVVFDHAAHILVQCIACHASPAHQDGVTRRPPMDTCFACHGLVHGPSGELASAECADCHPASFKRRPASHVKDWAGAPHARASKADGVNRCMMCHDAPADCDGCHTKEAPEVGPMPLVYLSTVPAPSFPATVTIDIDAPVAMGQCAFCHSDIDDFQVEGLMFKHAPHLERAYRCVTCHPAFPHGPAGTDRPPMRPCYRCHGLYHNGQGDVASGACEVCHTKDFKLVPADHTKAFITGEHKTGARDDAARCSQCHPSAACVKCHNGSGKLADGKPAKKVVPADHRKPQWRSEHGPLYLEQKGLCAVCHTSESCQQCHVTTMPHPATWLADHARGKGSLAKDCNVCHADRTVCQECHHASVGSQALVRENCVGCHEEMKTEPATDIKVAGLAEHAVHFGVEEKKGEPYYCEDCHIGFGPGGVHVTSPATGPHDMRICYECHGALDYRNIRIAPWPGSELCLRCHKDLKI
jgi:hypothetical protein